MAEKTNQLPFLPEFSVKARVCLIQNREIGLNILKLLLTSNGFYTEPIKEQFLKLINGATNEMDVDIITTASPQKENDRFAQKAKEDIREMGFQNIDFIDLEFDNPECLTDKDHIHQWWKSI